MINMSLGACANRRILNRLRRLNMAIVVQQYILYKFNNSLIVLRRYTQTGLDIRYPHMCQTFFHGAPFLLIPLQIFILHSVCFQQFITILLNVNSKLLLRSLDIKAVHDNSLYWILEFVHVVGTEVGRMIKIWFSCQIVCFLLKWLYFKRK